MYNAHYTQYISETLRAIKKDGARLDIAANGIWGGQFERAYFNANTMYIVYKKFGESITPIRYNLVNSSAIVDTLY